MSDTLEIRNGHLQYGKTVIASNMSAAFLKPEIVSIIGPNGSGKSTLLKALGRLLKRQRLERVKVGSRGQTYFRPTAVGTSSGRYDRAGISGMRSNSLSIRFFPIVAG